MKQVKMGKVSLSELSIGFWRIAESNMSIDEINELLNEASKVGIDSIDTAVVYGNHAHHAEEILGEVFKKYPEQKEKFKVVTKTGIPKNVSFPHYNQSYDHIIESCEGSLKALNIDCIDVFLLHRPDVFADFNEVYRAMKHLLDEGKIKEVGVSNYTPCAFESIKRYFKKRGINLVTNQIELNLFCDEHIQNDNIFYLKGNEISPMIWSPVGGGRIKDVSDEVKAIATKYNITPAALSYAYLKNMGLNPHIILGSFKIERYHEAIIGLNKQIEMEDMYKLLKTTTGVDIR